MQLLFLATAFTGYFLVELFYETIAETSADYYYSDFAALFWGLPQTSPEELTLRAATGPEIEYLRQICSMPFL